MKAHERIDDIDAEIEVAAKRLAAVAAGEALALSERGDLHLIEALHIERRVLERSAALLSVRITRLTEEITRLTEEAEK